VRPADRSLRAGEQFEKLKAQAARLSPGAEDQVVGVVYRDATNAGGIITLGEFVVAGRNTLCKYPKTGKYPFHFRKTFTPQSRPIQRHETPAIEFAKTAAIYEAMPGKVPEPLGFNTWTYRSAPVCGWTLNASSPFIELAYEDALALDPNLETLTKHTQGVLAVCGLLEQFHARGIAHGDLTFHNAMLYLDGTCIQPILIDLASSVRLGKLSEQDQQHAIADDFSELYRDLVLAQVYLGPLRNAHAQKATQQMDELFPLDILPKLAKLKPAKRPEIELE
jgi:hypothetical protein